VSAENVFFVRLAQQVEITVNNMDIGVISLRTGAGKKEMIKGCRGYIGQHFRQRDGRFIGAIKETVVIGKRMQLIGNGCNNFRLAVTEIAAP
jgi:hypothetical protein